jgi:CSLREA domain-containing protein
MMKDCLAAMKPPQLFCLRMGTAPRFRRVIAASGLLRNSFARRNRILALLVPLIGFALAVSAPAATFTVDSTGDESDAKPGSGVCGTLLGVNKTDPDRGPCTLRAAIQEANALAGTDTIQFNIPASDPKCVDGVCTINLTTALPALSTNVSILGPGASQLIVRLFSNCSTAECFYRIFSVTTASPVTISGLTISGGRDFGIDGGGIANLGAATVNIANCTISGNAAFFDGGKGGGGGAVANTGGGRVNISGSTMSDNTSQGGGGIYNIAGGIVTVRDSTLVRNQSVASSGSVAFGGAIANFSGTTNVTNSTITGNTANGPGGGIVNSDTMSVTNCTISGNSAMGSGETGGNLGGGIYSESNNTSVKSSIIARNTAADGGPDVNGLFNSAGFNLIGNRIGSTGFNTATDQTGGSKETALDPKLDPNGLQNNGGPTETIKLLVGSPAIDKGTSAGLTGNLTTDQRGTGFPRTSDNLQISPAAGGDNTDIGAFEVQVAVPTPTPTPTATPSATPAVTPTATPTATPVTTLANISTRLRVETGDNVLIGGFIITGTQSKKVIVRGIGTSLPLADKLADPTLELHGPNGLIDSNDNWVDSPNKQAIIDSTIPPTSDLESAIVATLPANNTGYTAIVRGVNNTTGIGVVEAYDLDTAVDSRLANISTRGLVQTGDNVLIAGTIVVGQTPQKVLIRAIGPSLPIAGILADPTLELRDSNGGLLQANDNWVDSPDKQAIIDTTIPPTNDLESAIVATLPANTSSYTAIVRGVNNTTGIAVVEVYALQ